MRTPLTVAKPFLNPGSDLTKAASEIPRGVEARDD
jgi:hypothetical protein